MVNDHKCKKRNSKTTVDAKTSAWDFAVVDKKLCCKACVLRRCFVEKSSIKNHEESAKHKKSLSDIAKNKAESQTIFTCLQRRDKSENVVGSSLPANMRLFLFEIRIFSSCSN